MGTRKEARVLSQSLAESLRTLRRAPSRRRLPMIKITPHPSLEATVARPFGFFRRKPGVIYVSRGLLALLNEAELRAVLVTGFDRLQTRGIKRASFYARCADKLSLNLNPTHASVFANPTSGLLTPPRAVLAWLTFPFYRYFKRRAALLDVLQSESRVVRPPLACHRPQDYSDSRWQTIPFPK